MKKRKIMLMSLILCVALVRIADIKGYTQNNDESGNASGSSVKQTETVTNTTNSTVNEKNIANGNSQSEEISNGSLFSTIKRGGMLMIVLVLLGLASLTLIIERIIFFTKHNVWQQDNLKKLLFNIADQSQTQYREDLEDELKNSFQIYASKTERGLALLSGIGNISPIVGFLGTVIGMISAFASIAAATTVNAKVVAVGIQIALVTTAGGLTVAVPTLAFYYLFTHVIQNRYSQANGIINELCEKKPRVSDNICE